MNHAAVSPLSIPVLEAVQTYLLDRHNGAIENFTSFLQIAGETRRLLADLVGSSAERIEFIPNTSYALNILAQGIEWKAGDRIAIPACEFPANVYPFLNLERKGVKIDFIPHEQGVFTIGDVLRALTEKTRLLSVSWVQFLSGYRCDLQELGALCRDRDILFSVDAIQGLGALTLPGSVDELGIDFLASGCHKWIMGMEGIGFLSLSENLNSKLRPPFAGWLHGPVNWDDFYSYKLEFHPDARRFNLGTANAPGIIALNAALRLYGEVGHNWCEEQVLSNTSEVRKGLRAIGLKVYGTADDRHSSGIVTFDPHDSEGLFHHLTERRVAVSFRNGMIRVAPTYYNSSDDISRFLQSVEEFPGIKSAI